MNCPALDYDDITCRDSSCDECGMVACIERTNCLLKQIVEKCKYQSFELDEEILNGNYPDKYKFFKSGRSDAGEEILKLLEIEECE